MTTEMADDRKHWHLMIQNIKLRKVRVTMIARHLGVRSTMHMWSAVAQLVECRTRNRESPGSNPVVTVSKFGHFLSLHDASVDSAVLMSTWL